MSRLQDSEDTADVESSNFEEARNGIHFNIKHIKLNVGGQIFKTSIETLVKDPDSMLAAMFSRRFNVKPNEDGTYFIDRDGTHFRYILNYLRSGNLDSSVKENKAILSEIYAEAEFYQICGLLKEIWPGPCFEGSSHIIPSLTSDQMDSLLSWLPPTPCLHNWIQRYSGVMDGWSAATFHKNCDERGSTVFIARVGWSTFGGYAHASWNTCGGFVKDEKSFLFLLSNSSGAAPAKLPSNNGGIWCSRNFGFAFGADEDNQREKDVLIRFMCEQDPDNFNRIWSQTGGFTVPENSALHNFLGIEERNFFMHYLEVFSLGKCF